MPTKIRLQRHGKKKYAYFHVVIADSRAPRDGKFIEKLGTYNPNTNPANIDIDFDRTLNWVKKGAQPTDTVRALLSYKGIIYKNHLDKGVLKGAFTQEEADKRFEAWLEEKEAKVSSKKEKISSSIDEERKKRLAAEKEMDDKRAASIATKNSNLAEEVQVGAAETESEAPQAEQAETQATEEVAAEVTPNTTEESVEETKETTAEEVEEKQEASNEETADTEVVEEKEENKVEAVEDVKEEATEEAKAADDSEETKKEDKANVEASAKTDTEEGKEEDTAKEEKPAE